MQYRQLGKIDLRIPLIRSKIVIFLTLGVILLAGVLFFIFLKTNLTSKLPSSLAVPIFKIVSAVPQINSKCPDGFILVPNNPLYQTSDFCVMKYDAKCADTSSLQVGLQPAGGSACSGGMKGIAEGVYKNNGKNCACVGNKKVVSTSSGFPITFIAESDKTSNNAKSYCQLNGWHLMTNAEWMTIARNVEAVPENWCNRDGTGCGFPLGTLTKILANGHNDNMGEASASANTHGALIASNDTEPCYGTTIDGSNKCGGKNSQKRTLMLSNGQIIWDFAGNVWQWIDAEVMRKDQPKSYTGKKLDTGWKWSDFTPGALPTVITDNGQIPALGYDSFRPSSPNWNSNNGVGRVYHYSNAQDNNTTLYTFIRGGNWRHGYDSGAFTIHMSPTANQENIDDVGFRCVFEVK